MNAPLLRSVVMRFLPLCLVLLVPTLAVAETETPDRTASRFRGAISLVGGVGLSTAYLDFNYGPGLSAEAGVLFNDSVAVVARATVATVLTRTVALFGLSVDRAIGEHVSLGVGVAYTVHGALIGEDLPAAMGISVPVRISWMFSERTEADRVRHGVYVFGEASPGFSFAASPGFVPMPPAPNAPFLISAVIGVGYGAW